MRYFKLKVRWYRHRIKAWIRWKVLYKLFLYKPRS